MISDPTSEPPSAPGLLSTPEPMTSAPTSRLPFAAGSSARSSGCAAASGPPVFEPQPAVHAAETAMASHSAERPVVFILRTSAHLSCARSGRQVKDDPL